jgi:hypothetical protein
MKWQTGHPTGQGLYLCRTTEGFGGMEVGYSVNYFNGYFRIEHGQTVTHWCEIDEPVDNEFEVYRDPLGRMRCVAQSHYRNVDLNNIGPGVEE